MKKNRTKRILSMLLTLCMVLTLVPMTAFAANAPANQVIINGVTLDSNDPYLVSGVKQSSGSLNGTTCTAHFDAVTGTLSLWNYNGNDIVAGAGGAVGAKDLTVKLKGTNTITGNLRNSTNGGNLIITAEEDAFLNITNSRDSDGVLTGISTYIAGYYLGEGSISIKGKANITISVTNTSTDGSARSYGLFAKQSISISQSASLDVTSTSHSSSDYSAYGIYAVNQSFTANTSGVISVDVSNTQNAKPIAIRADSYSLTKVNQLLCKYNSTGSDFYKGFTPPAEFAYNKGVVSGTPTTEIRGGSTPVRTATFVGVRNNFGKWTGQYFSGDKVGLIAETFGIPFSSWQSSAGSFYSTTIPNTTFYMPNEDVTITVRYNAFNYHPFFTKTKSGEGTILFNLHAMPDSATTPRLVTKNGDETNIVAEKYFYGDNLPREVTITDGTTSHDVPAGEYRVAVKIGGLWHFSEVFTVNYDAPVTTYAVHVTGGTGGGNYAEGDIVTITANEPATGKEWDKWIAIGLSGDGDYEFECDTFSFIMPANDVAFTATYKDAPVTTYAVHVTGGTGGGNYAEGDTVTITANEPATGKEWDKWIAIGLSGDGDYEFEFDTFSFIMPANDVAFTATYKDAPVTTYAVHVTGGTGGGNYAEGEIVTITANEPATGKEWDKWIATGLSGDGDYEFELDTFSFIMPANYVAFTATYKDAPVTTYAVTVTGGTGGGNFAAGAIVTITANAPATGKVFDKWTTTDGVAFANANTTTTTFVMPAKAVTVTATYKDAPVTTYAVTVTNGTGGGSFAEGSTVNITANAPETGKVFDKWTSSDGVSFADSSKANTSFVMPAKNVTVTATYKDIPASTYTVSVKNGTANKNAATSGETITITADNAPDGKVFDKWTSSDDISFADVGKTSTSFVMPAKNVTVTATYKEIPTGTYLITVKNGTSNKNSAAPGDAVTITANSAVSGKVFDKWTSSDGVSFADSSKANTSFVMPSKAVTVTALFKDAPNTNTDKEIKLKKDSDYIVADDALVVKTAPQGGLTASTILSQVETQGVKILDKNGKELSGKASAGTGSRLILLDSSGKEIDSFTLVLFGDTNGDGKITAVDARHVLRVSARLDSIDGVFLQAAKAGKDGGIRATDARTIIRVSARLDVF